MNRLLTSTNIIKNLSRNCFRDLNRSLAQTTRQTFATKSTKDTGGDAETVDPNKPVPYLQSPAASWKAEDSMSGVKDEAPWQESWSILISVSVFLIYFCVLREENDIDEKFARPLYTSVEGLEQQNLLVTHKYNAANGVSNKDIEKRMRELGMNVEEILKNN